MLLCSFLFSCSESHIFGGFSSQRATSDEMERIMRHYEKSDEDEVKLLDKPEQ